MTLSMFGGGFDPFSTVFGTDPFFSDIATPLSFGGFGDVGTTGRRGTRGRRRGAAAGGADMDVDVGHWHFDYYLSEPCQLELEEHNDCYLMRLFHAGVEKDKIKLDIENDTLIVSGEYQPEALRESTAATQGQTQEKEMKTETSTTAPTTGQGQTQAQGQGQTQAQGQVQGQGQAEQAAHEHGTKKTRVSPRRSYKRFIRYMALPQDVDQASIDAKHVGEHLEVCLKKIQGTTPRVQRIPIK